MSTSDDEVASLEGDVNETWRVPSQLGSTVEIMSRVAFDFIYFFPIFELEILMHLNTEDLALGLVISMVSQIIPVIQIFF